MELNSLTAWQLAELLKNGEVCAEDIIAALSKRAREKEQKVKAYVRFDGSLSAVPVEVTGGTGELAGIPVSIKDNISTRGFNTECCSKILRGYKPPYDATVIEKLKQSGARVISVKTNMDEFAFGSSTENSCFGASRNPWDIGRVPGGSSGGAAAAVAADEAVLSLGSDTGGSIRQPASFCGVVGMKPTYGRVSRYGLVAFASSLDQIGPITKDVRDSAALLKVIAGYDRRDSTSVDQPVPDYPACLGKDIRGMRVGVPKEYMVQGIDPEVREALLKALEELKRLGASCSEVSLPHTEFAVPVYYIIATAEASSNLARFDGVRYGRRAEDVSEGITGMYSRTRGEGFGKEAKRRVILGTFALSHGYYDAYYSRALKVRTLIKNDFEKVFNEFDCIVAPTSPTPAFPLGEKSNDPLKMYLSDIYTISANLAGIPAISLPCGFTSAGLPIGMQVMAGHFREESIFKLAHAYEQCSGNAADKRKPVL